MSYFARAESKLPARTFAVLTWADLALLLALAAFLIVMCAVRSRTRLLWADELLGDRLLNAPTSVGAMRGWWEGADGGGPMYYVLGRLWVGLFGHTALSLRMFSAAGMAAGLALVWTAARRYFSLVSVAWSSAVVYLYAAGVRWQEVNGRFYGLFFAAAALASLWFLVVADRQTSRKDLVMTGLAHALLIGSHILGMVYSFSLIVGMVGLDCVRGQVRWKLYASAVAGWTMLLLSAHAIYRSTSIAKDVFWTSRPAHHEFLLGLGASNALVMRLVFILLLLALAKVGLQHKFGAVWRSLPSSSATWLCGCLILAQALLFLKSQRGISIYADRYLIPLTAVTVFLLAACLDGLLDQWRFFKGGSCAALGIALLVIVPVASYAIRQKDLDQLYPYLGLPERIAAQLPPHAPVLVSYLPDFTLLTRYDPSRRYYFLIDWPYDLRPDHPRGDYSGQREMENWRRAGYLPDRIVECPRVFEENESLYLLLDPGRMDWLADRLLHNPAFLSKQIGGSNEWAPYSLWVVQRVLPGPAPC